MEVITQFRGFNPPSLQDSVTKKSPRNNNSTLVRVAETQFSAALPSTTPPSLHSVNGYHQRNYLDSVKIRHAWMAKLGEREDSDDKTRSLINSYLKSGDFRSATMLFFVGWNQNHMKWETFLRRIDSYGRDPFEALEMFCELHSRGVSFDAKVLGVILKMCAHLGILRLGMEFHACLIKSGGAEYANQVFDEMRSQEVLLWNKAVLANCTDGGWTVALQLFKDMQFSFVEANTTTLSKVLQACGKLKGLDEGSFLNRGKEIHSHVIRNGLDHDISVGTSLLNMYVKNNNLTYGRAVFDRMKGRNIVAWNILISGYSLSGQFEDAIFLSNRMENEGLKPNLITYQGLVHGLSMWGHNEDALAMIQDMKVLGLTPNVAIWTTLISGCLWKGKFGDALEFSIKMQEEGVKPNETTIFYLLRACACLSLLRKGKEIHCFGIRNGIIEENSPTVIEMYTKCGSLESAHKVFRKLKDKPLASWNIMIMGFALYSRGKEAISLFNEMQEAGIWPCSITFTALLSACSYSGLVDEGWKYFDSMKVNYNIIPKIEHYACMANLLARAGYLDETWDFIKGMPMEPDSAFWGGLLPLCRIHEDLSLAEIAAENLFKLEPKNPANYVRLMHLYANLNRWDDVERIRELMEVKELRTGMVWSWIQINHTVHIFSDRGRQPPDEGLIFFELYQLVSEMKCLGYKPDIKCVHQNIDDEEKEKILLTHTEKRAITYGLLKTSGVPIRVIKNVRVCSDCHTVAKYISLMRSREILLKDGSRFHHFREGKCSCNDFW